MSPQARGIAVLCEKPIDLDLQCVRPILEGGTSPLMMGFAHFIGCIRSEVPCTPDFADGLAALELADAAERSARTGTSVTVIAGALA